MKRILDPWLVVLAVAWHLFGRWHRVEHAHFADTMLVDCSCGKVWSL